MKGVKRDLPGGNSMWVPPESISNSEVKTHSADDSAGSPRVKVGHCQALNTKKAPWKYPGAFFMFVWSYLSTKECENSAGARFRKRREAMMPKALCGHTRNPH